MYLPYKAFQLGRHQIIRENSNAGMKQVKQKGYCDTTKIHGPPPLYPLVINNEQPLCKKAWRTETIIV